jgi:transposase-like protein
LESAQTDKHSRRRFTKELKVETVALARKSGKPIAEIHRDMGLADSTVHRRGPGMDRS